MPKVKVEGRSKHSAADTFQKVRKLLEGDRDLRKMDSTYVCEFNETSLTGSAKGAKFEAQMKIIPQDQGSAVEIEVTLPLLLTPIKGIVQSTLQKKIESALA